MAGDAWFLNSLTKTNEIPRFEKTTGINVKVIHVGQQALFQGLKRQSETHTGPYDLIVIRHQFLGGLVKSGEVQPIGSLLGNPKLQPSNFNPRRQLFSNLWHEISWYGNQAYGYPYTFLTAVLCWRKDLMEDPKEKALFKKHYHKDLEPPQTWQEYNELARFFSRPSEHLYGTYIQGQKHVALWYEWLNLSYSFGGNILDTKQGDQYGDIVVNSPQNIAATEQYLSLISFSPPETLDYNWNNALAALQQGRVFMGLLWSDQLPLLEDLSLSKTAGKFGYSLIPSATGHPFSQLEGLTYLIPSQATHPREAFRFMAWAMSTEVQAAQMQHGITSAVKAAYKFPNVRKLPYVPTLFASIPIAVPKPTVPESPKITDMMVKALRKTVTQKCSPKQGLDAAALGIQQILGAKARLRFAAKTHGCTIINDRGN